MWSEMFDRLFKNLFTTTTGVLGGAATGAATMIVQQGPTKEAAINGAIFGACTALIGAAGGAAIDPKRGPEVIKGLTPEENKES